MKTYVDAKGRTIILEFNLGTLRACRDLVGIDLLSPENKIIDRIGQDLAVLGDVLWGIAGISLMAQGMSRADFEAGLAGDAIMDAAQAFAEGYVGFFPKKAIHGYARALTSVSPASRPGQLPPTSPSTATPANSSGKKPEKKGTTSGVTDTQGSAVSTPSDSASANS